jgi:uncharacterized membrane protein (DUF485 family)
MPETLQYKTELRHRLYQDERVRRLVAKKQRRVFLLSMLVLLIFFGFVSTMAFKPEWLAARFTNGDLETPGILISFILVLTMYGIMFMYVRRQMVEDNSDVRELVETISNE